jgi:hypothetical protein
MGHFAELCKKYNGRINSLQKSKKLRIAVVTQAGVSNGKITLKKSVNRLHPSIIADSSSSLGIVSTNAYVRDTAKGIFVAAYSRTVPTTVLVRSVACIIFVSVT